MESNRKVLCIGLVCYDIVSVVDHFPIEDTQMRTQEQRRSRGGNASNTATVLSHLNVPSEFLGSLPSDSTPDLTFVEEDFKNHQITYANCPRHKGYLLPNSCIISNVLSGSRTILHTNDGLPELCVEDLSSINMQDYNWIHIEGRPNANELTKIAKMFKERCPNIPISLEMEKPARANKDELFQLLPYIDLLFISKECASSLGATNMRDAVYLLQDILPLNACIVCPWGEKGASGKDAKGNVFEIPCYPPPSGKVIDTIGAGDTFNAAVIAGIVMQDVGNKIGAESWLNLGIDLKQAVEKGCKVAGTKVGMVGFSELSNINFN